MDLSSFTGPASDFFSSVPADWLILGAVAIAAALDCVRAGARRVATAALALPLAFLVSEGIEGTAILGGIQSQLNTPLLQAAFFAGLLVLCYIFVHRIGLSWGGESGQTIQAAVAGVAAAVLAAVFWLQVPALVELWQFGPGFERIFGSSYSVFWLLGSYAALAFVRK